MARPGFIALRGVFGGRSEEHTSELQSRPHLVCRLLLEKKKGLEVLATALESEIETHRGQLDSDARVESCAVDAPEHDGRLPCDRPRLAGARGPLADTAAIPHSRLWGARDVSANTAGTFSTQPPHNQSLCHFGLRVVRVLSPHRRPSLYHSFFF